MGLYTVSGVLNESSKIQIQVYNLLGQSVYRKVIDRAISINEVIDLTRFPNGNYYVLFRLDNGLVSRKKIIKVGNLYPL
jgi:hypothetical protein